MKIRWDPRGSPKFFYPLSAICLAISLLLGIGSASGFSIYLGQKEPERAAALVGNGIFLMTAAGILLLLGERFLPRLLWGFGAADEVMPFAGQYAGVTLLEMPFLILKTASAIGSVQMAAQDTRWSVWWRERLPTRFWIRFFIFVFRWEGFGAALATFLRQILSFSLAIRYLWNFRTIKLTKACFKINMRDNLYTLHMGTSSCLNQIAITIVQMVLNNPLTYDGALSVYGKEILLAAGGIVMQTNAILLSIVVGISQGVQPIIGYNFGAEKYDRVKQAYRLAIQWDFAVSAIGFCLFQFFPRQMISILGNGDPLCYEFSVLFVRTFLFMVLVNGVQLLSSNFFTAIGKALKGLLLFLTRQVFFLILLILILPLWFGIFGVPLAGPIADFIAFVVSLIPVHGKFKYLDTQGACAKSKKIPA